jgi:hypothetical protein
MDSMPVLLFLVMMSSSACCSKFMIVVFKIQCSVSHNVVAVMTSTLSTLCESFDV